MARRMIRAVGIHPNFGKRGSRAVFDKLVPWLTGEGCDVFVSEEVEGRLPEGVQRVPQQQLPERIHLLVVLGGDGTLLGAARMLFPHEVPVLGVNFGGLGFLTDVHVRDLFPALEQTLRGDYSIERRMMLKISILGRNDRPRATFFGLNDAVVRESGHRLLDLTMSIGGTTVGRFRADGLVIATPTGSTAYSLSAGGPIVQPLLDTLIATPIAAHKLTLRPVVFPAYEKVRVTPETLGAEAHLIVDGQVLLEIHPGEAVLVGRAEKDSCFVQLRKRSFYDVLREKLSWGA
ncbi:MAG: NAD(+)/NADH kinase [Candidatus Eisenbacteria bacterium]|nr:NAD(+)/NADH kinase [Candidatus Eisenbacteria bacterium]